MQIINYKKSYNKSKLGIILAAILALTLVFSGCGNGKAEAATLDTFKKLDDCGLYYLEYTDDYLFDDFLKTGAKTDDELTKYLTDNLLEGSNVEIKVPGAGCTTFSGELKSGDRIFARNFDFSSAMPLVLKTNPKNGYKSMSTVNLEFIGYSYDSPPEAGDEESLLPLLVTPYIPLDGINEKGLAIGVLQINWIAAKQSVEGKVSLPTTTMIRMVLDKAATVDEAIMLMKKYNIADSLGANFHYQIADRTGRSVVVEYVSNPVLNSVDMVVIEKEAGNDYQFAENFLLSKSGAMLQSQLNPSGIGAKARYGILKTGLEANKGKFTDMQDAMKLLAEADQDTRTHWSVVYNLNNCSSLFVPKVQHERPLTFTVI